MEDEEIPKTKEIKNFSLSYDGIYWIIEDKGRYPILLNPDDLAVLFEVEGLDIKVKLKELNNDNGYRFRKATLIRANSAKGGDYFDAGGNWFALYECHVKRT